MLLALDEIKFGSEAAEEIDILGDAYEYMIAQFAAGAGKRPASSTLRKRSVRFSPTS